MSSEKDTPAPVKHHHRWYSAGCKLCDDGVPYEGDDSTRLPRDELEAERSVPDNKEETSDRDPPLVTTPRPLAEIPSDGSTVGASVTWDPDRAAQLSLRAGLAYDKGHEDTAVEVLLELSAMALKRVDELDAALAELSACTCGCPLDDHETYDEGIGCSNDAHECLHCYPAVSMMFADLRDQLAAARNTYEQYRRERDLSIEQRDAVITDRQRVESQWRMMRAELDEQRRRHEELLRFALDGASGALREAMGVAPFEVRPLELSAAIDGGDYGPSPLRPFMRRWLSKHRKRPESGGAAPVAESSDLQASGQSSPGNPDDGGGDADRGRPSSQGCVAGTSEKIGADVTARIPRATPETSGRS